MGLSDFSSKQGRNNDPGVTVVESNVNQLPDDLATIGMAPTFIIAYVSPYLDVGHVAALIFSRFPDVPKMICSTAGELVARKGSLYCEAGRYWDRVVVQCFDASIIAQAEVVSLPLDCEDLRQGKIEISLHERVKRLKHQIRNLNVAMQIDYRDTLAYILFDGLSASESFFMEALYDSGRFPCLFVGGSAGGKLDFQNTWLHDGRNRFENHALIAFLKTAPGIRFGIMKSQNFVPMEVSFSILSASVEHRYVSQVIDNKGRIVSLVAALCDTFECQPSALEALMDEYSFAISVGEELFVRSVSGVDIEMDTVHFYCDISPGEELLLIRKGDLVQSTIRDFKQFMEEKPGAPIAGILNDCIQRRLLNESQLPEMGNVLTGSAIAGFSTFGEILGLFLNQTLTGIFFFRVTEGKPFKDRYVDNFIFNLGEFKAFFLKRQIAKLNGLSQIVVRQIEDFKANRYGSRLDATGMDPIMATVFDGLNELGDTLRAADTHQRLMTNQIEAQLRESEKRFRLLAESSLTGIYLILSGRFSYVNDAFAHIFGLSVSEIIGKLGVTDLVAPEDRRLVAENIRRRQAGEVQSMRYAFRALRKNGSIFHVEVYGRRIKYKGKVGVIGTLIDITEQKKAEEKLRASEERYRAFYNETPSMFFTIDDEGIITAVNDFGANQLGYAKNELLGNFFSNLFYEDDKDSAWDGIASCLQTPWLIFHRQLRMIGKNGSPMWIEAFVRSVRGPKENVNILVACQDITPRKQLEESLRLTQFIFDKAPIGIWKMGTGGEVLDVNEQGCNSLGYSRDELCRMKVFDFDPNFDTKIWADNISTLKAAGITTIETLHQCKNGEIFPIQVIQNLVRFEDQEFHVAFVLDITERKQNEQELRRLRNYLSNIIDSMPSALVAVDRDGNVTQWNNKTEQITGLSFEKAWNQPLPDVFPLLAGEMERIRTAIRERRTIYTPKVSRKIAQGTRFEDITIFPLVANGVEGAVIRVDDVTERIRLEEMMIQSEKMLSVGGLAAGMAHEVNNPLAGILQNASVLENRLLGDLPANHKAAEAAGITLSAIRQYLEMRNLPGMLENIRESGSRAAAIVRNMLSFARKSDRRVSTHDLCVLLDQALELVRTDYDMKKCYDVKQIRITREYDPVALPIPCEASKLQQVFMNILKNGAEAMAEVKDKTAPPAFILRVRNEDVWVRVEIEDNGPGMDEKTRRRIFEPFFTTKPVGKGTGLGLSVSYFIVTEDHGGEMSAHAAKGGGTRFVIRLPKGGGDR
ncbi:two component system sensor histidine kinase [Desulfosarcina variabilis str. Montpellier]|uniref:PAS domain S-box protein n=1 Tax=Desulfosarcina variabilis TaxID=2300 RepID=UPI003AFB5817